MSGDPGHCCSACSRLDGAWTLDLGHPQLLIFRGFGKQQANSSSRGGRLMFLGRAGCFSAGAVWLAGFKV